MIKVVYCLTKKDGMTDEEFFRYWKDVHGPIGAKIPGLHKLVQSHRLAITADRKHADYDGMAELWFDNVKTLLAARESPEWKAASKDEENFINPKKTAYFVTEEHTIRDEPGREEFV
ncbi:MAG TPA: EthD domain-containing protein [Candidatus Angelobacter sp.]|nr:EthD domain-containing protein [Candidatus Angelobacter sp.]